MKFASHAALSGLSGARATIQVGDESAAFYSATVNSVLTGRAALEKTGKSELVRTGVTTYSGGTTIAAGTLVGSATSFGTGAIVNNATLEPAQASNGTLSNQLSGNGALIKSGAGTRLFIGDGTGLTGSMQVLGGTLAANDPWNPLTRYCILTAAGGVTGQFATLSSNFAFLTPTLAYSAQEVTLGLLRNEVDFAPITPPIHSPQVPCKVLARAGGALAVPTGPAAPPSD